MHPARPVTTRLQTITLRIAQILHLS